MLSTQCTFFSFKQVKNLFFSPLNCFYCISSRIANQSGMQFIRRKNERKYANEFKNMQMRLKAGENMQISLTCNFNELKLQTCLRCNLYSLWTVGEKGRLGL